MRLLRGRRSLRALQSEGGFSRSQLSAYETGQRLPPLALADSLDALYDAGGWIAMSIRSLSRESWDPWRAERSASSMHAFAWDAAYEGMVWITLKPTETNGSRAHRVISEWGPWRRVDLFELPAAGLTLLTGKAADADGIAKTYNLTADPAVFALAGFGDLRDDEHVCDVRQGWQLQSTAP
jgi:hypothetical protein